MKRGLAASPPHNGLRGLLGAERLGSRAGCPAASWEGTGMRGVCLWGGGQRQLSIDSRRLEFIRHKSREAILSFATEPIKSSGPLQEAWVGDGRGWPGLGSSWDLHALALVCEASSQSPVLRFSLATK